MAAKKSTSLAASVDDERAEALSAFLTQMGKEHPGEVLRLNDSRRVNIDVVPTGAISLDVAIGAGGFPRGKIIELYGGEGGGKCLTASTMLWTDQGLETLGELFTRCGADLGTDELVTDVTSLGVQVVNEFGDLENVSALTHNSLRETRRVTLESGRAVEATLNHPLRVVDASGEIIWRQVGDIAVGDTVVSAPFGAQQSNGTDFLGVDDAALLGYLSSLAVAEDRCANLSGGAGDDLVALQQTICPDGPLPASFGVTHADLWSGVPYAVRTSGAKLQASYLSALFECDAEVHPDRIELAVAGPLAEQVQLLLLGLGVTAALSRSGRRSALHITGSSSLGQFAGTVGFRTPLRAAQLDALVGTWQGKDLVATTPTSRDEQFRAEYLLERVVAVHDAGVQPTFDISVPSTSSFIANGICSHNTTVALTVAANAQKLGGNVGFIDAEHGLNRQLCNNIGIDPDRFVVFQPDHGEQAIDMVEQMIRSKAFDVIIVDSVAAMTPKAEIESEVEQQFMGLHARLMSKFMRRVAGLANENGVMLICVNQIRKNLQAYGTPDETTGGKAIKFYASLRIEVRTSGSKKITKGGEIVGHTVVATVKKNRLGPPHTTAEFDLIYGQGLDGSGALLDVAEKVGVLSRAGAYYTEAATGERLSEKVDGDKPRVVVGKEAAKDLLRRDDELRERLTAAVYAALDGQPIETSGDPEHDEDFDPNVD